MLNKSQYSQKIIEIFQNDPRNMPETNFEKLTHEEIVQYGYLSGAKKIKKDITKNGYSEHLNLQSEYMYTQVDLNQNEASFRNQNAIFYGSPGAGKTYLSAKLAKAYFCESFIPEEFRESEDFFDGIYAQGISGNISFRKIVFISESHCLDMFSRNIKQITAKEHFNGKICYGAWDLEDLSSADFLAIQDIGSRRAHSSFSETLFSILDTRFEDISKVTVFTTNASEESLSDVYGGQFTDRLKTFMSSTINSSSKRKFKQKTRTKQKFQYYTSGD